MFTAAVIVVSVVVAAAVVQVVVPSLQLRQPTRLVLRARAARLISQGARGAASDREAAW